MFELMNCILFVIRFTSRQGSPALRKAILSLPGDLAEIVI